MRLLQVNHHVKPLADERREGSIRPTEKRGVHSPPSWSVGCSRRDVFFPRSQSSVCVQNTSYMLSTLCNTRGSDQTICVASLQKEEIARMIAKKKKKKKKKKHYTSTRSPPPSLLPSPPPSSPPHRQFLFCNPKNPSFFKFEQPFHFSLLPCTHHIPSFFFLFASVKLCFNPFFESFFFCC